LAHFQDSAGKRSWREAAREIFGVPKASFQGKCSRQVFKPSFQGRLSDRLSLETV
jgi:hypothetical protein